MACTPLVHNIPAPEQKKTNTTHHIKRLKHLPLVARPIPVQRERRIRLPAVLLRKRDPRTQRHLRTHDPVPAKERRGKDVHRPSLPVRHPNLPSQQLPQHPRDRAPAHHRKRMTPVRSDHPVIRRNPMLQSHRDRFLHHKISKSQLEKGFPAPHLSDSQVTKPSDQLGLVQRVRSHLHPPHRRHLLVHLQQLVLRHLHLQRRHLCLVRPERVLVQLHGERLRRVRRAGFELRRVLHRRLQPTHETPSRPLVRVMSYQKPQTRNRPPTAYTHHPA